MKVLYEGTIGAIRFVMVDKATIEVWSNYDSEHPESYSYVKEGAVKNEKDFHYEIMSWYAKNSEN